MVSSLLLPSIVCSPVPSLDDRTQRSAITSQKLLQLNGQPSGLPVLLQNAAVTGTLEFMAARFLLSWPVPVVGSPVARPSPIHKEQRPLLTLLSQEVSLLPGTVSMLLSAVRIHSLIQHALPCASSCRSALPLDTDAAVHSVRPQIQADGRNKLLSLLCLSVPRL